MQANDAMTPTAQIPAKNIVVIGAYLDITA